MTSREIAEKFLEKLDDFECNLNKKELSQLKKILEEANGMYYMTGSTFLTDDEFDNLKNEYKRHRDAEPLNLLQKAESSKKEGKKKIKQDLNGFLCTVEKVYSPEELIEWIKNRKNFTEINFTKPIGILVSHKYDGCSIAIEFKNGAVKRAFSRGQDGEGQDYSHWFEGKKYSDVEDGIYKFEAVMTWKDFEKYSAEYSKTNGKGLAHPRNAVSGILNAKKDKTTQKYFDYYISFAPLDCYGKYPIDRNDFIKKLWTSGLKTIEYRHWWMVFDRGVLYNGEDKAENIFKLYATVNATRDGLDYPIDGLVVEFTDESLINELGFGDVDGKPCPKFACGLKFPYKTKNTILEDIEFDVADSPTGRLTPCACFKPVTIDGRVFKRVSLSNFDRFKNEKFFKGEEVTLTIRGDVLGYISKFPESAKNKKIKEENKEYFQLPTKCPVCGGKVKFNETGTWLFCTNENCPRKKTGSIINYLDKMRIKNIGPNTIEFMADNGYISNIVDLYRFDDDMLKTEEGFGEKSVNVIQEALNERREVYDYEFFGALGWVGLSRGVMKKLFSIMTFKELLKYFRTKLSKDFIAFIKNNVEGFDTILAKNLLDGLSEMMQMPEDDCPLILIDAEEIKILDSKDMGDKNSQHFKVVVTGDLEKYKRDVFKIMIEKKGHSLISAVSNKTDYVITNFPNSGTVKIKKAKELGIPIINEKEAYDILGIE